MAEAMGATGNYRRSYRMKITGKQYMGLVAALPCAKCCQHPVEVHHIKQFSGMSQRGSDFLTIPLCSVCHRTGRDSIHQNTMMEGKYLAQTIEKIVNMLAAYRMPF